MPRRLIGVAVLVVAALATGLPAQTRHFPVSDLKPGRSTGVLTLDSRIVNQRGETVMTGFQRYLLRKRPAPTG